MTEEKRKAKRAVITGAAGVVGYALVKECCGAGMDLLLLLREGSAHNARMCALAEALSGSAMRRDGAYAVFDGSVEGRPRILLAECSLEHMKEMKRDGGADWDIFYHLGWSGTKGKDRFDPYIHTQNVLYALDAVQLAHRLGCRCFVGAGSQAEYGRCAERLTPDTPAKPENAYGAGKLSAGHMTRIMAHGLHMEHIWTRILSVYGPADGEKTLITSLVASLLRGERPRMTKGEQIWDYVSSEDAARALRLIGERGADGETYLIASGEERSLIDYVRELVEVVAPGAEIGYGELPYAEKQVMHLAADISKTCRDTGWKPEISFREGIRRMAEEARR